MRRRSPVPRLPEPFGWLFVAVAVLAVAFWLFVLLPARRDCAARGGVLVQDATGLPACVGNPTIALPAGGSHGR